MTIDKIIQSRRSIRTFSDKKPDWRDIIKAIDAARYAPMAGNIFTPKFILVNDKEKIKKIAGFSQQPFVASTDYVVVVCSKPLLAKIPFPEKGEEFLHQQNGAAIQNFLLKLEELNLVTCWIGYFIEREIRNILKIPQGVNIEAIFPIGRKPKQKKDTQKRKINLDAYLYFNIYGEKRMHP